MDNFFEELGRSFGNMPRPLTQKLGLRFMGEKKSKLKPVLCKYCKKTVVLYCPSNPTAEQKLMLAQLVNTPCSKCVPSKEYIKILCDQYD